MTSRIIRESALTSYSLDQLSDGAERLWWRLTLVADDHGRFNADPRVVLATCFPLRSGATDPAAIAAWLDELEGVGGICRYDLNGHRYGVFVNWPSYQRPPRYRSRFPAPPEHVSVSSVDNVDSRYQPLPAANSGQELSKEWSGVMSNEGSRYQPPSAAISGSPDPQNPVSHTPKNPEPRQRSVPYQDLKHQTIRTTQPGAHDSVTIGAHDTPTSVEQTRQILDRIRQARDVATPNPNADPPHDDPT